MNSGSGTKFWIDENLSPRIGRCLRILGFSSERCSGHTPDDQILLVIGASDDSRPVWITGDLSARYEFREEIRQSGASVAWVRANHFDATTQFFIVFSFVHQLNDTLASSDQPLYFNVHLITENGLVSVRIDPTAL